MPGRSEISAFLGLGGNLGDPRAAMAAALKLLDTGPDTRVVTVSSLYRTPPWGKTDQPDFLNAAAEIATVLQPRALLQRCLDIEKDLKRERKERWGPRVIDMDILVYDGLTIREEGLEVPHPRMLERAFVLMPLAEIAPNLTMEGTTFVGHLARLDTAGIERLDAPADWWRVTGSA
ncbi:2-amino-4-hydroxy-6-hydroxymethyldihydropteridine diphosphokinase [Corticibacterium sp. UT-5YL-CI-8]|nr:2-amino-4-hydroxy-6-hydroxymethyldihydropteridine diphosphokinase [Tianweitania sp. UT-5YL-CI-8]